MDQQIGAGAIVDDILIVTRIAGKVSHSRRLVLKFGSRAGRDNDVTVLFLPPGDEAPIPLEAPVSNALLPRSLRSMASDLHMLDQLRLFGRVLQSLRSDVIETQNLGETICDVATAQSIQHRGFGVGRDLCKEVIDVGADPASRLNILPGDKNLLVFRHSEIDVAQCDPLGRTAEMKTAALADGGQDHALTSQRDQQLANEARICAEALGQGSARASEAVLIRERQAQNHLQCGRKS